VEKWWVLLLTKKQNKEKGRGSSFLWAEDLLDELEGEHDEEGHLLGAHQF
jgi:hypothetical protein